LEDQPLSPRAYLRYLRSDEGPFSKYPKMMKHTVRGLANLCAIPLYELDDDMRAILGAYISQHKAESLYLIHRIHAEFLIMQWDDKEFGLTANVLRRFFGERGMLTLWEAAKKYQLEDELIEPAVERAQLTAEASLRDHTVLRGTPEYRQAVETGRRFVGRDPTPHAWEENDWLAYWGVHYLWFSHLMENPALGEWVYQQRMAAGMIEAMGEVLRSLGRR
jgi:hypothetical protein